MTEFKSWRSFQQFDQRVRQHLRYVRVAEDEDFLATVAETSHYRETTIPAGRHLWRAQIGHSFREIKQQEETFEVESPHAADRMKPLRDRATGGRANPVGIPCLYLATHKETAMSEVRPWMGSLISVGQFRVLRDCRIIDCSRDHKKFPLYFEEPELADKRQAVWAHIDRAFAEPMISQDGVGEYVSTQILAELFKRGGFDGVAYKSKFGEDGYNVALFDLDAADLINCFLFDVREIEMKFEERSDPYFVQKYYDEKKADQNEANID